MTNDAVRLLRLVDEHSYRRVIFDLDGTLTRLVLPWTDWITEVTGELPPPARERLAATMATPGAAWGSRLNEHLLAGEISAGKVIDITRRFESRNFAHYPNDLMIRSVHQLASKGCTLFIWSNNMHGTCSRVLNDLHIAHLFQGVVGRDDVRLGKPHKEGWLAIQAGTDPQVHLLVGDSANDRSAAAAAGIAYFQTSFDSNPDDVPRYCLAAGLDSADSGVFSEPDSQV